MTASSFDFPSLNNSVQIHELACNFLHRLFFAPPPVDQNYLLLSSIPFLTYPKFHLAYTYLSAFHQIYHMHWTNLSLSCLTQLNLIKLIILPLIITAYSKMYGNYYGDDHVFRFFHFNINVEIMQYKQSRFQTVLQSCIQVTRFTFVSVHVSTLNT